MRRAIASSVRTTTGFIDTFANNGKNPDGGYIPKNSDDKTPLKVSSYWNAIEPFHNDGYDYFLWPNGALDDYCCGNLKIVSEAEGGKVRFGQNSMEFNYDYSSYNGMVQRNFQHSLLRREQISTSPARRRRSAFGYMRPRARRHTACMRTWSPGIRPAARINGPIRA